MVTFTNHRGVTLCANAVQNGARNTAPRPLEFTDRLEGRERRRVRRARISDKRAFLASM